MGCNGGCGGKSAKPEIAPGFVRIALATNDPFAEPEIFRDDWQHVHVSFNGARIGPGNVCNAKSGDNGYVDMMVFRGGQLVMLDDNGRKYPKTRRIEGSVVIQALNNYKMCPVCRDSAQKLRWWEV